MTVRSRSAAWRAWGAARNLVTFLLLVPIVAVVPPHAPWAIGSLAAGAWFARRRWMERETLERVDGVCPKCSEPLRAKPGRLRVPHPLTCEACHHQGTLRPADPTRALP